MDRGLAALLLLALFLVSPLGMGQASGAAPGPSLGIPGLTGGPPVPSGKVVAPGAFGVPFAYTSSVDLPSFPATQNPLVDGELVYDTQLSIEVENANPYAISLPVTIEVWTPGTVQVLRNVSLPNGSYAMQYVSEPARLDPVWANTTVAAVPDSSGFVSVQLAVTTQVLPMEVRVGSAVWELKYLTAATSLVSGIYTAGGIWGYTLAVVLISFLSVLVAWLFAKRLIKRVHSVPKPRAIWAILWVGIPIALFVLAYVPMNQFLAGLSPLVIPIPVGIAFFPYIARGLAKRECGRLEGLELRNLEEARRAEGVTHVVDTEFGLRLAPRSWREVLYTLAGVPLPAIEGEEVEVLGHRVRVQPKGMRVSKLFEDPRFESEAERVFWVDASRKPQQVPHRFRWTREVVVEKEVEGPDGKPRIQKVKKRRLSPHIEPGYLRARFPPTRPVLEVLAGVRAAESLAHDHEADQLVIADMRGTLYSKVREHERLYEVQLDESYRLKGKMKSPEELQRIVEARLASRRSTGGQPPAPAEE